MEIAKLADVFIHLDKYLDVLVASYGSLIYIILFAVIFCETGLVITPFLPGDSLLFAVGALAGMQILDIRILLVIFIVAAIAGDSINYFIGHRFGTKLFANPDSKIFKRKYLEETKEFYAKYGNMAVILARFVPIMRTFVPFVAGIGAMSYDKFYTSNVIGGVVWTTLFLFGGYLFGNLPVIKNNFSVAILIIILASITPGIIGIMKKRRTTPPLFPDDTAATK